MYVCKSHVRLAALPLALSVCWPSAVSAQGSPALATTVVTASRMEQALADLVADVSIVDRSTIERSGAAGLAELLARLPGIQISRNGGQAGATSVFVRGAETRHTAVYLDGVRLDSQATGGVQWEQIPLSQIERIEVLRGPAAAVYGSDAIGGVVQLFTKKGEGKPAPYVSAGLGSHQTYQLEAGVSGSTGVDRQLDYAVGLAHARSDGFNAQPQRLRQPGDGQRNPDHDGYERQSAHARLGLQINRAHRLDATVLASQLTSQYDNFVSVPADLDADDTSHYRLRTAGLTWAAQWSAAYSTRLQVTDSHARYATSPSPYRSVTDLRGYLLQNEYRLGAHLLSATLERREDALHNGEVDGQRSQNALALGYGFNHGAHALQLHLRRDDDSAFGGKTTGSAAYGHAITPQLRATLSAGTSFRAPTLYQRFSEAGLASLQPESGRNVEAGLRWTEGASSLGVVAYRNRVRNMIVFGAPGPCASPWGCYESVGRAKYQGITLSAGHAVANVQLRASVDFQNPKDLDSGLLLARRAKRYATLGADTQLAGWTVGTEVQASGQRYDDAANTRRLGGYMLVNLYASTPIARDFMLTARVDNLADKAYESVRLYDTGGRTLWVALKWAPQ